MAKFLWEFGKILTLSIRQPCGRRRQALRSSVRSSVCPSLRGGSGKISRELKETENNAKILLLRGVGWEQSETKSEWEARAGSTAPPFVSHPWKIKFGRGTRTQLLYIRERGGLKCVTWSTRTHTHGQPTIRSQICASVVETLTTGEATLQKLRDCNREGDNTTHPSHPQSTYVRKERRVPALHQYRTVS